MSSNSPGRGGNIFGEEIALSAMDEQLNQKVRNFPNLLSLQDILQFGTIHILGLYEKKKKSDFKIEHRNHYFKLQPQMVLIL